MSDPMVACKNCSFWVKDAEGDEGECRINPPQLLVMPMNTLAGPGVGAMPMVPRTRGDFWCGSFRKAYVTKEPRFDVINPVHVKDRTTTDIAQGQVL